MSLKVDLGKAGIEDEGRNLIEEKHMISSKLGKRQGSDTVH